MNTENNKLIVDFMGKPDHIMPELLKYSTSWDWLMPVVEKIESLPILPYAKLLDLEVDDTLTGHFWFRRITTSTEIFVSCHYWQIDRQIPGLTKEHNAETPILSLYSAVVEFINWYNSQPKP